MNKGVCIQDRLSVMDPGGCFAACVAQSHARLLNHIQGLSNLVTLSNTQDISTLTCARCTHGMLLHMRH
eukprot:1154142-Pelagomonas_calceolata.AAC.2